jgi:hypothetical protein
MEVSSIDYSYVLAVVIISVTIISLIAYRRHKIYI